MRQASSQRRTRRLQEEILEQFKCTPPQPCQQLVPATTPTLIALICHLSARITDMTHHIVCEEAATCARRALTCVFARIAHLTTTRIFRRRRRHQHVLHCTSAARSAARSPSATRTNACGLLMFLSREHHHRARTPSATRTNARRLRRLTGRRLKRLRGEQERGVEARGQEKLVLVQLAETI